jgi:hypothetical protein
MITGFVEIANRAVEAGFDCFEVQSVHGCLVSQFYHCWSVLAFFHNRANPADLFCWRLICAVRLRLKTVLIDYKGGTKDELFE